MQQQIAARVAHVPDVAQPKRGGRPRYLLTGLLRCEECGSGFHSLGSGDRFGCSGRHHRGAATCGNALRASAAVLEARVLGAIREQILVPELALYVVEKTLEKLRARRESGDLAKLRQELAQASAEVARLVAIAAEVPDVPELVARLKLAHHERAAMVARLRAAEVAIPDGADLRAAVERRLADLGAELASERGREVLHALFRGDRLTVRPDIDACFRIDGTAWLRLPVHEGPARVDQDSGRVHGVVAGGGFEPPTSGL